MKSHFGKLVLILMICSLMTDPALCPNAFGQQPIVGGLKEKANPFAKKKTIKGSGGQLTDFVDPKERDRLRVSGDIPQADSFANVNFKRAEDKSPDEMNEEDFFKTMTPAETVILTPTPKKPIEFFRAGVLIASAGRPQFSRLCFAKIKEIVAKDAKQAITPEEYVKVIDEVGFGRVLYLITNTVVGQEGTEAAQKAMEAARTVWENPAHLDAAAKRFVKDSIPEKAAALIALRKGGNVSVSILIDLLTKASDSEIEPLQRLLALLDENSFEALIVTLLNTKDEKLAERITGIFRQKISALIPDVYLALYYDTSFSEKFRNELMKKELARCFGSIPSLDEATARLDKKAHGWFRREVTQPVLINGKASVWSWDESTQKAVYKDLDSDQYYREGTVIWARQCWRIGQNVKEDALKNRILALALTAVSEKILFDKGLNNPLDTTPLSKEFPNAQTADYERALVLALDEDHPKGGILPAIFLGKSEKQDLCYGKNNIPSPLVQAATSSDRRLRFTALSAISRLNPDKPYLGSSRIIPSLILFTTSHGNKKVIVAAPKIQDALRFGDFFVQEGYTVVPTTTGGNLVRLAQLDADVEMVAATTLIGTPDMLTVTQILGQDYRTADIPVLLCAHSVSFPRPVQASSEKIWSKNPQDIPFEADKGIIVNAYNPGDQNVTREVWAIRLSDQNIDPKGVAQELSENLISSPEITKKIKAPILFEIETKTNNDLALNMSGGFSNVLSLPMPYDKNSAHWAIDELFGKTKVDPVPAPIRKAQGKAAAAMLLRLYASHPEIYLIDDVIFLVQRYLSSDDFLEEGLQLAMLVREPKVQQILSDKLGDTRLPLQIRQEILTVYINHLDKFGNLLRGPEIQALYDRYNASEKEDPETQKILSDMLDAYEKTAKTKK